MLATSVDLFSASFQLLASDSHVQWCVQHLPDKAGLEQLRINKSCITLQQVCKHLLRHCVVLPTLKRQSCCQHVHTKHALCLPVQELKAKHREVMQDVLMDVLRALTSPNMDIRKKTLDIALDLITSRNIDEVVMVLKKEVMKTQNKELDKGPEYRQLLVQAIHSCAVKFPDVAGSVIHLLMDFLGDTNTASALDVVFFVREIMETNSKLRASILERLLDSYNQIRSSRVCSCTLWIIGEYCDQKDDIYAALEVGILAVSCCPSDLCCLLCLHSDPGHPAIYAWLLNKLTPKGVVRSACTVCFGL